MRCADAAEPRMAQRGSHVSVDLSELEGRALAARDPAAAAYITRGAGDEDARRANLDAWRALRLRPHVLRDVSTVDSTTTVLGIPIAAPILVAPTALQQLMCPDGARATARAAAGASSVMITSMSSSLPLAEIAAAARDAGVRAIVASLDAGAIPYGRRATDELPAHVTQLVDDYDASVTVDDIMQLGAWGGLPIVAKGVLRGDDAATCVAAGVAAVYVSNHGGRLVDGCVDTAAALVDVVRAVRGRADVYVDGGIRSGVDVLRALALGATAVALGRPVLWGLATGGEAGALAVLEQFRAELGRAMAFCGAGTLGDVDADLVLPSGA